MTFVASAFGLTFVSAVAVPGLVPGAPPAPDAITLRLGMLPDWLGAEPPARARTLYPRADEAHPAFPVRVRWAEGAGAFLFDYADGTRFVMDRAATEVWAAWPVGATLEDTATYLLGPVAGFLLRLRGRVPLHGSGIVVDGGVVGLVGASGAGKSTTAAAFAARGVPVLADDILALSRVGGGIYVHAAYPYLRLWPESVEILFGSRDALPLLTPNWDKRYLDLAGRGELFRGGSLALSALYILGERSSAADAPSIRPIPPREALLTLVANTSSNQFLDAGMRRTEFLILDGLVRAVPVSRVVPHSDPARLPELCDAILHDLASRPGDV